MPKHFTVQCMYACYYANQVTVRADTLEEAIPKAIEEANLSSSWSSLDDVGSTFVNAAAEGEDVDLWKDYSADAALAIPFQHTETGLHARSLYQAAADVVDAYDNGGPERAVECIAKQIETLRSLLVPA